MNKNYCKNIRHIPSYFLIYLQSGTNRLPTNLYKDYTIAQYQCQLSQIILKEKFKKTY